MKTVVTITGIRPDFIRMSAIFAKLDAAPWCRHYMIHTGQHYDDMLSGIFFKELGIRSPDYNLNCGKEAESHFEQLAFLSTELPLLMKQTKPDIILFLGDSNSVCAALPLKKEGYFIGHIEAGMRSQDRRMLEEINRIICDHCSDFLFVYTHDYCHNLMREGIDKDKIFVVGNTIVEVALPYVNDLLSKYDIKDKILVDIHRPENFKNPHRLARIIDFANYAGSMCKLPVYMLSFGRTDKALEDFAINTESIIPERLMSYKEYLGAVHSSAFLISDSGTAQEEPALLNVPVIVPRDFTERWASVKNNCSRMLDLDEDGVAEWAAHLLWVEAINSGIEEMDSDWLGDGTTASQIVQILKDRL